MSKMDDLASKLRQKRSDEELALNAWNARVTEWNEAVSALFKQIEGWTKPLVSNELATLTIGSQKVEPGVRIPGSKDYDVPTLSIEIEGKTLKLIPMSARTTDAPGIVRALYGTDAAHLVRPSSGRYKDVWNIRPEINTPEIPLSIDVFAELLEAVISKSK